MNCIKFRRIVFPSIVICLIVLLTACVFVACDNVDAQQRQVPVYKGMYISGGSASASALPADDNGNHYGHYKGDHEHRDDDFDEDKPFDDTKAPSIEDKAQSTLDVVGAGQDIYYADAGQDVFITIKLSNPDSYEILSFTLNGKKYSNYMFEEGSDMENLVLKVNVGNVGGIHDYTIDAIKYVDGTDIKDVRMDGDRTVKAGVRAYDQTYASVSNEKKSMTSISFDVQVVDLYSLVQASGGYAKAVLYDGVNMTSKDITVGEKTSVTFDNLTPNTVYQYGVVALYDDLSGSGIKLNTLYKKAVYTDTIVLFKDIEVGQETLSWGYVWNDAVENKTITALELMQNDVKVKDVEATATSVDGLKTNNEYTLKATYKNLQNQDESIRITFTTLTKAVPSVEIANVVPTQTSVDFAINVTDTDSVGVIAKIELLHGEDTPIVVENTDRTIENLLSNNDYTIKVTYTYDLNDGAGNRNIVKTADFKTLEKAAPSVEIGNWTNTQNKLSADVTYTDVDSVGRIESVVLFKGVTQVATTNERTHVVFDTLECDTEYTLVVTYKYDLNDGNGEQTATQSAKRYTAPQFELVEATCANTSAVSKGEIIYFEAKVVNPSGVVIERIKINDKYYTPSSGTTKTSIIVNITVEDQFEGGNTALEVTEIEGTLHGQKVTIVPSESNVANVFVNGELSVKSIKIVDEDGKECDMVVAGKQYYYLVSFSNKTGYSIDKIDKYSLANGDYTMQDAETAKISVTFSLGWNSVALRKVEYSNTSLGNKTKDVNGVSTPTILCLENEVPIVISTAEQLKIMNDWGYYVLENDLDLGGTEWKDPSGFKGYFDGQGHAIKNMNFVGTVENTNFNWGLFAYSSGIIKNLMLNGRLIVTIKEGVDKSYSATVGGLCTYANDLMIDNITNDISMAITNILGHVSVGGLVGYSGYLSIVHSCNRAFISSTSMTGVVGGLVGDIDLTEAYGIMKKDIIMNSYNVGNVSSNQYAGGLVGRFDALDDDVALNITNSYNEGDVTAKACAGGLVGEVYAMLTISYCKNTGNVTSNSSAGGLVGMNKGRLIVICSNNSGDISASFAAGGFVANIENSDTVSFTNCFNQGVVSNSSHAGGFVGSVTNTSVNITDCFNAGTLESNEIAGGIIGSISPGGMFMTNSYNIGSVAATKEAGAFIGSVAERSEISSDNSYFTTFDDGKGYGEKIDSVAEIVVIMKDVWDNTVWDFDNLDENGNPTLKI